jgi:hypothetical protein
MSKISEFFGTLPDGVKDVELDGDQEFYLDPLSIDWVLDEDFDAEDAKALLYTYMAGVDSLLDHPESKARLMKLIEVPKEINETRLGLGCGKPQGNATSAPMLLKVFTLMRKIAGLNTDEHPESLPMFTPRFGADRYSDLITNILSVVLIAYTQRKCRKLGIPMTNGHRMNVFNPSKLRWETVETDLPEANGLGILMVPEKILVTQYAYTAQRYVQFEVLSGIQFMYKMQGKKFSKKEIFEARTAGINGDVTKTFALNEAIREPKRYVGYLDKLRVLTR